MDGRYFLGIDGGGTKTHLVLQDGDGAWQRELVVSGCNPIDIGIEKAEAVLYSAITDICADIPADRIAMYAGVSGGTSGCNRPELNEFFSRFGFGAYANGSDNDLIIAAGLCGGDGVAVILGTGICLFRVSDGRRSRLAGRGYLFDGGGSGYDIGRDGLCACFAASDGIGPETHIAEFVYQRAGCSHEALLGKLYSGGKRYIASFCPDVFAAAQEYGDSLAESIILSNARRAAQLIYAAGKPIDGQVRVVLAGGLTKRAEYVSKIKAGLREPEKFSISVLQEQPVYGALELARKLSVKE